MLRSLLTGKRGKIIYEDEGQIVIDHGKWIETIVARNAHQFVSGREGHVHQPEREYYFYQIESG